MRITAQRPYALKENSAMRTKIAVGGHFTFTAGAVSIFHYSTIPSILIVLICSFHLFRYRLCLQEEQQVIPSPRLRIGAGHVETAEGMNADHRARNFSVNVEIAYMEISFGLFDFLAVVRPDTAR